MGTENYSEDFIKNFFVSLGTIKGNSKIIFGSGNKDFHYTFHFGEKSGYLDIHKTFNGTDKHDTLIKINREDAFSIFKRISELLPSVLKTIKLRKLNLSIIDQTKFILVSTYNENNLETYFKIKPKRFSFVKNLNIKELEGSIFPFTQINNTEGIIFGLYDRKLKFKGFIFKMINGNTTLDLFFISKENISNFLKYFVDIVKDSTQPLDIKYKDEIIAHLLNIYSFSNE